MNISDKVFASTGMREVTSDIQKRNGTIAFYDAVRDETYTIHPKTGYARRRLDSSTIYQLNRKTMRVTTHNWNMCQYVSRYVHRIREYDIDGLVELVIRAWNARERKVAR